MAVSLTQLRTLARQRLESAWRLKATKRAIADFDAAAK